MERASRCWTSSLKGLPMSTVLFAFFIKPLSRESAPGVPMPTGHVRPSSRSAPATSAQTARTMPS
jgi:hypothetical protein